MIGGIAHDFVNKAFYNFNQLTILFHNKSVVHFEGGQVLQHGSAFQTVSCDDSYYTRCVGITTEGAAVAWSSTFYDLSSAGVGANVVELLNSGNKVVALLSDGVARYFEMDRPSETLQTLPGIIRVMISAVGAFALDGTGAVRVFSVDSFLFTSADLAIAQAGTGLSAVHVNDAGMILVDASGAVKVAGAMIRHMQRVVDGKKVDKVVSNGGAFLLKFQDEGAGITIGLPGHGGLECISGTPAVAFSFAPSVSPSASPTSLAPTVNPTGAPVPSWAPTASPVPQPSSTPPSTGDGSRAAPTVVVSLTALSFVLASLACAY